MSDHPIEGLMTTAMENLKEMIDVNTIIGDPVETPDGSIIMTISKVGFGFAAGGSEFMMNQQSGQDKSPFGGGSGGGVSITPVAFLIVKGDDVRLLHVDENTHLLDKIIDLAPGVIDKIQGMMGKKNTNQSSSSSGSQSSSSKKPPSDYSI
ncbi:GerW family sporulation protein [Bacillus thermotolerans]|uniref:Sporulation protein n=1 Tax=Bacillus thermotolerans TaxID=1221996 RepID=A0A0F5ID62_BACTR|nr:GerW family sporulation protein [Bacillus thermotolerans]KKB37581.1 Sporulation protein [Bacillus thermotolerans]KKB42191.1 Sporulation protein [Bacillus thermotolerans]KKB43280.1 Sporulation protein [Bacillus thermotolerans]